MLTFKRRPLLLPVAASSKNIYSKVSIIIGRQQVLFFKSLSTTTKTQSTSILAKASSVAALDYNRWLVMPFAVTTHLCIGGLYAWSVLNEPLTRTLGVVSNSSGDWVLSSIVPVFSTAVCAAGATGAVSGKWAESAGPRKSVFLAGTLWGGGMMLGGLGVELHQLGLVYLGYGVLGGMGIGFAYSPPVATLLRWFPDRKGMASGMAIMGFGSGALVALPAIRHLVERNFVSPTYLGTADSVGTIVNEGRRFLTDHPTTEVVIASASDIAKLGLTQHILEPGVYVVGTGSTGVAATLMTIGAVYSATMMLASLGYKIPAEGWSPPSLSSSPMIQQQGSDNNNDKNKEVLAETKPRGDPLLIPAGSYVTAADAMKTRQFAQVWTSLFLNATAGIAVLGVAKTLMSDVFSSTMPTVVDATFCAGYVGALSLFNGVGRLAWAATSDVIGRKNTFSLFFALGVPLYLSVPVTAHMAGVSEGIAPLAIFTASTLSIITMYGGGFSASPAYLADLFGSKEVGNIYGKLLTAWSVAGMVGPTLLAKLRRVSEIDAIKELTAKVDPIKFQQQFGMMPDKINDLIDSNTVSIAKLLHISPVGTMDPSPYLYDSSMKTMAALLVVGFANNYFMKPVDPKLIRKI